MFPRSEPTATAPPQSTGAPQAPSGVEAMGNETVTTTTGDVCAYRAATADERAEAIGQLAALQCATHAELLRLVAAMDKERDWAADGATDPCAWVVAVCGVTRDRARAWVRVAHALEALPALRAAYAAGRLSWDQIEAVTRFATPETEAEVLAEVEGLSARQVRLLARQRRPITRPEAEDAERLTSLVFRPDHRRGGIRVNGFLTTDMGASVAAALGRHAESMGPNPVTGRWDPLPRRLALALHDVASSANSQAIATRPDLATVVLHADVEIVDGSVAGNGTVGDATVAHDGVLRALCDAKVELHLHHPDGPVVGATRSSRTIPPWLRRAVTHRDGTCRFPGCERPIRQLHHIHHWSRGGHHATWNLVGLCWDHHTLVHEGGWRIEGNPEGCVTFVDHFRIRRWESRPDGLRPSTLAGSPLARLRADSDDPP